MLLDVQEAHTIRAALRLARRRISKLIDNFPHLDFGALTQLLDELSAIELALDRILNPEEAGR